MPYQKQDLCQIISQVGIFSNNTLGLVGQENPKHATLNNVKALRTG